MPGSPLSFASTSTFRNTLLTKNLPPYTVQGAFTPPSGPTQFEVNLSNSPVIDSPDGLINDDPFAQQLYPLNQYGPPGGYRLDQTFNNPPLPVASNSGEYDPNDTKLDLVNEFFIDAAYVENRYGPAGGYNDMVIIDDIQNNNRIYQPYWDPPYFNTSTYTAYNILTSTDPIGSDGLLSQDSFLAKLGAQTLKNLLSDNINRNIYITNFGVTSLDSLQDPFEISLLITGQQQLINRNWTITVPENPVLAATTYLNRLMGSYFPVSPIPGDYFLQAEVNNGQSTQISTALNVTNQLTGGFLGPILFAQRNASQVFLANTGNGQRSALFSNLYYNRYQPGYDKTFGGILGGVAGIGSLILSVLDPNVGTLTGGYYVGSRNAEPGLIDSPPNQLPVDPFGRQIQTSVYGPSELGILYEGNQENLKFGLAAKSLIDGGGTDGQFIWTSPKYKDNAGFRPTVGGGVGGLDNEYNLISGYILKDESTNFTYRASSILDSTQRLVDSADKTSGINRLKHVGNAINQVSKVFNDGYKEMTKGSKVLLYADNTTGTQVGTEYCRVFAKDTPYYTYNDLQKVDGITTSGRRFTNSVLDNTYNLNISPTKNPGSTNIQPNAQGKTIAKKYMFSLENLAWRTSSRPGFTYDELPDCEKGPNGGRVMWFPPYDIKFTESNQANWTSTSFLGRPEPIYTYRDTNRTGTLNWKIVVDSPSVLNIIVDQQLKGVNKERTNSILESFFAGCVKYDIYELAKRYGQLSFNDLFLIQEVLNYPTVNKQQAAEAISAIGQQNLPVGNGTNTTSQVEPQVDNSVQNFKDKYQEFAFYFDNDIPGPNKGTTTSVNYADTFAAYTSPSNINLYTQTAQGIFKSGSTEANVKEFFDNVVISNFNLISQGTSNFIDEAVKLLDSNNSITIIMEGSASATASVAYNKDLSERRINSVKNYFATTKLKNYLDKTFIIKSAGGTGEQTVIPKTATELKGGNVTSASFNIGGDINCTTDIKDKNGKVTKQSQVYSVNAMACRRVKIQSIVTSPIVPITKPEPTPVPQVASVNDSPVVENVTPTVVKTVVEKSKEGISKFVLRKLLSECSYFEMIKSDVPFLYDAIREKIRYFNPAFHSMTPEGLNSRLTFLNQCVRPGETIPVIGTDNKPKYNDALNTAFGAPPVLVLRIGDFYNTKIIPKNISYTFEPLVLDLNPEGIGVQPMIANVTLTFDFIGGSGLQEPIDRLQNALSFNYYANTEIFDERAVPTENTETIDQEVLQAILARQGQFELVNTETQQTNQGGTTIGEITLTNPLAPSGETGDINYLKVMDNLLSSSKNYFTNIVNQFESVVKTYNYGIWQLITQDRNYTVGTWDIFENETKEVPIYGKPNNVETKIDNLFSAFTQDVNTAQSSNQNYIIFNLVKLSFSEGDINKIQNNFSQYITSFKTDFSSPLFTLINNSIVIPQQDYVQLIRKLNVVNKKTDGLITQAGIPKIYDISGTTDVSKSSPGPPSSTLIELGNDYRLQAVTAQLYDKFFVEQDIITTVKVPYGLSGPGSFAPLSDLKLLSIQDKRMFMVMAQVFTDKNKLTQFKEALLSGSVKESSSYSKLKTKLDKICDDFTVIVKKELTSETSFVNNIKKLPDYNRFANQDAYSKGKTRNCNYVTTPSTGTDAQKKYISDLYATVTLDPNDTKTYTNKNKFN